MISPAYPAPRPPLGFRVGITGARPNRLDPAAVPALRAAVLAVLHVVRAAAESAAAEPAVGAVYQSDSALLRLISPLAEGADRIAAEAALGAGFRLEAPMPFAEAEYEKTFSPDPPPGFPPFRPLLAQALTESAESASLTLDGSREQDAEAGYRAVGRFVVRHSDLLIAIWDGKDGKPGGTAEIVRYAAHAEVPIWWIETSGLQPARLLLGPAMFERRLAAPAGESAQARLSLMLRAVIAPPDPGEPVRHGWLGEAMHRLALAAGNRREPLPAFFAEAGEPERPRLWRTYGGLLRLLAPPAPESAGPAAAPAAVPGPEPDDGVESAWAATQETADRHGAAYADRYRSCYVLVILLAAATMAALGFGLALPHPGASGWTLPRLVGLVLTAFEFLALASIAAVVMASEWGRWHERWIAYRLLAELCRKQRVLARLGWSLPVARVSAMPEAREREWNGARMPRDSPRDSWVAWYVSAMMRAAPLPHGAIAAHLPRARALGEAMIAEQIAYHRNRSRQSLVAARRLGKVTDAAFIATILLVLAKLALIFADWHSASLGWLGAVSVALVALSAASVSLRSYAEFGLLHLQSERMLRGLARSEQLLGAIHLERPLASVAVGAVMHALALAMLEDVEGWSLLFRTKAPETG
ncbi:MAG: hypothetical protein ACREFJ_15135 [Acetobacteraceae bacterium]